MKTGYAIATMLLVAAGSAAWAESVGQAVDDATIKAKIETTYLFNEYLSPFSIKTTVVNGVVTLSGGVADPVQSELAEDLAKSVDGVKEVVNKLTVVPTAKPNKPKRGWKQIVEDKTVSATVRAQLLYYRDLKGLELGVRTENNVVTLSGVVDSEEKKKSIGQIADETRGVDRVINNLTVAPRQGIDSANDVGRGLTDEFTEKRVETRILLNRYLSIRQLDVEVNNKVCILTGTVDTAAQKKLAGSIAENTVGVDKVQNDLHVRTEATPEAAAQPAQSTTEMEMLKPEDEPTGPPPSVQQESLPSPAPAPAAP